MRTLLLISFLALFGFAGTAPDSDLELRISSPNHGVQLEFAPGKGSPVTMAGPRSSIILSEGVTLRVNDLNSAEVSARLDSENGWTIWEGSYSVELIEEGEVRTTAYVQDATMILGRFDDPSEGWVVEGD